MTHAFTARTLSPFVAFVAALALVAAAVLAGMLTTAGSDKAGVNKSAGRCGTRPTPRPARSGTRSARLPTVPSGTDASPERVLFPACRSHFVTPR